MPNALHTCRLVPLLLLAALAALHFGERDSRAEDRYWALLHDGTEVTGDNLKNWIHASGSPELAGRKLLDGDNPVRTLRDRHRTWRTSPPYLEMANGDVVPGTPRRVEGLEGGNPLPPHLCVEGSPEAAFLDGQEEIRIRLEAVSRFVLHAGVGEPEPGTVVLRDGRRLQARSWRWSASGVRVLTGEGVLDFAFSEIAAAAAPNIDPLAALHDDAAAPHNPESPFLIRLLTSDGGCYTFPQGMVQNEVPTERIRRSERNRRLTDSPPTAVQPAWALTALLIDPEQVAVTSYRRRDEIPLSLLPFAVSRTAVGLHDWKPRRQQSVRGTPLRSGSLQTDLGLGVHGESRLVFELPAGAAEFSGWVGLDRLTGGGGNAACRVIGGGGETKTLWETRLAGNVAPARFGPLALAGVSRLELVTESRPANSEAAADPWDIRDQIDWLMPLFRVEGFGAKEEYARPIGHWIPELAGWELAPESHELVDFQPSWDGDLLRWKTALCWRKGAPIEEDLAIRLVRHETITPANAWLPIEAARADDTGSGMVFSLEVNGEKHSTTMNGNLGTAHIGRLKKNSRVWALGAYAGREVELTLRIEPYRGSPAGTVFHKAGLLPLVEDLGEARRVLSPDVPLTQLKPSESKGVAAEKLRDGHTFDDKPLEVLGYRFEKGFGLPQGSEVSYPLDPSYRRFVACIGLADGWKGAGPYELLLDGEPHWNSGSEVFGRNTAGRQIDVHIPPGHETLTIRVLGDESTGALAHAGFMTK